MENPIISIIIPHWNGIDVLSECLESLANSNYENKEIIVVDNASSDGSQNWIRENHPNVILIENDDNYGYAGGCNRGVPHAKGEWLLFLNNDTIHEPDWIDHLAEGASNSAPEGIWTCFVTLLQKVGSFWNKKRTRVNMIHQVTFFGLQEQPLWSKKMCSMMLVVLMNYFLHIRKK